MLYHSLAYGLTASFSHPDSIDPRWRHPAAALTAGLAANAGVDRAEITNGVVLPMRKRL